MLQAYATVSFLKNNHVNYELIRYEKDKRLSTIIKSIPRLLNGVLLNDKYEAVKKKIGMLQHPKIRMKDAERLRAFKKFQEQYFDHLSPVFHGYRALCEGATRYSAVITGSDQLWSPAGLPTNFYNLMFVPDTILKISIASSFGVKEIPWYQKKRTAYFLNRMDFVSMRESRGAEIVKELTGKTVPTILDPVFLLSEKEWLKEIPNRKTYNQPYIFAYFLGTTSSYREAVTIFAKKRGLKVITLRHMDQYVPGDENFGDFAPYDIGPADFLNYIRNADYIFTDSFHGTAFSIINQKQFVVFDRYKSSSKHSKNSRIDTLCSNLGLESRRFATGNTLEDMISSPIDYNKVNNKVREQKLITDQYISTVLHAIQKREQK